MASQEVDSKLQKQLDEFSTTSRQCFREKNFDGFVSAVHSQWELLPDPKEQWEESFRIASTMITLFSTYYINFEKAEKWLRTLDNLDKIQQQHPGEVSLMKGKIYFEKKEFTEAKIAFEKAFKDSDGHCFGSGDEKYSEFFNNPQNN
ncbi:tetratricopeptide (TPR) repeat protein [Pedobacter sp. UYP30]|uniref:hypothetical protein n=1 Tax=Pedobacter sp. UYP30 TaxID=1756400 RepID=UPI0033992ECC